MFGGSTFCEILMNHKFRICVCIMYEYQNENGVPPTCTFSSWFLFRAPSFPLANQRPLLLRRHLHFYTNYRSLAPLSLWFSEKSLSSWFFIVASACAMSNKTFVETVNFLIFSFCFRAFNEGDFLNDFHHSFNFEILSTHRVLYFVGIIWKKNTSKTCLFYESAAPTIWCGILPTNFTQSTTTRVQIFIAGGVDSADAIAFTFPENSIHKTQHNRVKSNFNKS